MQRKIRCWFLALDYPLLIVSNGIFIAAKSATDKFVAKNISNDKSASDICRC